MSVLDDPRVQVDEYVVYPTGYDDLLHSDKDHWCLTVTNGHAWGWSVRPGRGMNSLFAMNRKGEFIVESRGSGRNKPRRYPLEEAIELALKYVDTVKWNGCTAKEASERVAARLKQMEEARG